MSLASLYGNLHTEVYNAIKNSPDVTAITDNVYDGYPTQLLKQTGYPVIVVSSPVGSDTPATLSTARKYDVLTTVSISIFSTKQSIARNIADAVRKAVATASYSSASFEGFTTANESFKYDEKTRKREWSITLYARFKVLDQW